ncbi:MAG TPA: cob(I)yrinic acid a,c-diamide adenosyltransferase [Methanosarcinales archaeon]|nr:cob(I)yrinic acid a,c-diamide adenosyltransferase [Methanosarcinales archaeon]
MKLGLVEVYTGTGKGKTTAALGTALRAVGHGFHVIVIQFLKGNYGYGEVQAIKLLPNFEIYQYGRKEFAVPRCPTEEDLEGINKAYEHAVQALLSEKYDLVILDEVLVAIDFEFLETAKVIDLIKIKPPNVELILTGRNAQNEIIEVADLVTEMREVKHPFQKGISARKGIDF